MPFQSDETVKRAIDGLKAIELATDRYAFAMNDRWFTTSTEALAHVGNTLRYFPEADTLEQILYEDGTKQMPAWWSPTERNLWRARADDGKPFGRITADIDTGEEVQLSGLSLDAMDLIL